MIGLRSLVESTRSAAWLRELDVRVKLAFLLTAAVLVVLIDAPATLLGLLVAVALVYAAGGIPAPKMRLALGIALLTVWGTMFSQALFYAAVPRTIVFELIPRDAPVLGALTGGLCVYREGLLYGAVQSVRIVTMIGLGLLVCWTTDPGEFLSALVRLRVPYGVAFMTVTAMRFLPAVVSEAGVVMTARRMRGYTLDRGRWLHPARQLVRFMKPMFANAIRRSRALALSVESRGFDPAARRTSLRDSRLGKWSATVLVLLLAALLSVAAMKFLHWLFMQDVYYSGGLWWLYEFVRSWL